MLPVLVWWVVEAAEFSWVVAVLLENNRDKMFEVLEIFLCSFLKGLIQKVTAKIHKLYFAVKRNPNILRTEIAMGYLHIIEKSVNPQKFLNVFVHVLMITPKGIDFRVKSTRKVLNWLVRVSRGMRWLVDGPWKAREVGKVLLEFQEKHEVGGKWQFIDSE